MKQNPESGEIHQGAVLLFALCFVIFVFILPSHKADPLHVSNFSTRSNWSLANDQGGSEYQNTPAPKRTSSYTNSISLNTGNGSSEYQPVDEYVTISNNGENPVNITGWKLKNVKGNEVFIPQAFSYVSPNGSGPLRDVILNPNETAVITTGGSGSKTPFNISSFKENKCSGYIENLPQYDFTPGLSLDCVYPQSEPGVRSLDRDCQDFLGRMSSCHTPDYQTYDYQGNFCNGCVDNNPSLSSSCVAFIKNHFSYQGCLAYHANDPNFSGQRWRIFLNRSWELWDKNREEIYLFDSRGNLVDYIAY